MERRLIAILIACLAQGCDGDGGAPRDLPAAASGTADVPAAKVAEDEGITARARLDDALAAARNWRPDVELIGVSAGLAEGPTSTYWAYDVQSPSQGTCNRILAFADGRVQDSGNEAECALMKPVSTGFVDSPAAWNAARAAGFEPGDAVQFSLRFQRDQALPESRECWVVWSDADGDEERGIVRGWCVDPANGAFVTRLSGYGRNEPR